MYPAYQLGWFPDYSDADNYLTPFFLDGELPREPLRQPGGQRPDPRAGRRRPTRRRAPQLIEEIQDARRRADLSTVPLLQGAQVAVAGADVEGVIARRVVQVPLRAAHEVGERLTDGAVSLTAGRPIGVLALRAHSTDRLPHDDE